jgi:hypothetical protein
MKLLVSAIAAAALASMITACGGGGGDEASADPQGFWTVDETGMLVTSSGEAWLISLTSPTYTLAKGQINTSGSTVSGNFVRYTSPTISFSASGIVRPKTSMTLTATGVDQSTASGTLLYSGLYDATPSVAGLAGSYAISSGGVVTIDAAGNVTASDTGTQCALAGQITADASGKNFYRLQVTTSGANCATDGMTASGVLARSTNTILLGGVISGSVGDAFVLTKMPD